VAESKRFSSLSAEYEGRADFLIIYIKEAHAQDGWTFKSIGDKINYAKTIQDRIAACQQFVDKYQPHQNIPVVIDELTDACRLGYDAWPERLYIIENGKIVYKGGRGPELYKIDEVGEWLRKRFP